MIFTGTVMMSNPPSHSQQQQQQSTQPSSNLLLTTTSLSSSAHQQQQQQQNSQHLYHHQPHTSINTISHLISANNNTSKYHQPNSTEQLTDNDLLMDQQQQQQLPAYSNSMNKTGIYKTHMQIQQQQNSRGTNNLTTNANAIINRSQQSFDQISISSQITTNNTKYNQQQRTQHHQHQQQQQQQQQHNNHHHQGGSVYSSSNSSTSTGMNPMLSNSTTNTMLSISKHMQQQPNLEDEINDEPPMVPVTNAPSLRGTNFDECNKSMGGGGGGVYDRIKEQRNRERDRVGGDGVDEQANEDEQKIQVQILPQDDNWGENTTAMTADFSDFNDDMTEDGRSMRLNFNPNHKQNMIESAYNSTSLLSILRHFFAKYIALLFTITILLSSFLTPILFITLPRLELDPDWLLNECGLECEGLLIGIAFKLFILLIGYWAMFLTKSRSKLPRVYELKALLIFVLLIMTFSYWLFYAVRIIEANVADYYKILQFTVSYVDVLLFVFVISVFVLELRHLKPTYVVRVIRSPDGEQQEYDLGTMSIQRAALFILDQYYRDFRVYNPWLENAHRKRTAQLVQLEQINNKKRGATNSKRSTEPSGGENDPDNFDTESTYRRHNSSTRKASNSSTKGGTNHVQSATSIVGVNMSANDRLYEEYEYERRLKKRKARLITTTEEAFAHIKRVQPEVNGNIDDDESEATTNQRRTNNNQQIRSGMDPMEAAQAVFTSIARDLRRYLRITRQQPYFTRDSIVAHLANCISYDMSPKAFLEKYVSGESLLFNERALINPFNQYKQLQMQQELMQKQQQQQQLVNRNNYSTGLKTLDQTWILISDNALYQNIEDNLMIVLKQNDVTLMCNFKRLPRFKLIEDILDPKRNKFMLKLNSETTV